MLLIVLRYKLFGSQTMLQNFSRDKDKLLGKLAPSSPPSLVSTRTTLLVSVLNIMLLLLLLIALFLNKLPVNKKAKGVSGGSRDAELQNCWQRLTQVLLTPRLPYSECLPLVA